MAIFLGGFGGVLWLVALGMLFSAPAVTQEIAAILIFLNGTVMIVGAGVISAAKSATSHRGSPSTSAVNSNNEFNTQTSEDITAESPSKTSANQESAPKELLGAMVVIIVIVLLVLAVVAYGPASSPSQ